MTKKGSRLFSRRNKKREEAGDPPNPASDAQTLMFLSPDWWNDRKELKAQLLRHLHFFLLHLSKDGSLHPENVGDASIEISNQWFSIKSYYTDILGLSSLLFGELQKQFDQLISGVGLVPSLNAALPPKNFILLLRCCILLLPLLEFDPVLVFGRCQILTSILDKLCSRELILPLSRYMGENDKQTTDPKGSVLHGSMCVSDSAFTPSMGDLDASACASGQVSVILIISSALEVFMDELLSNQQLRKQLIVTDYVSCTREKLMSYCGNVDVEIVLEAVCAHFSLSISNVRAFNKFLQSLYWLYRRDDEIPQLRLHSALVLLSPHIMLSTPQMLQTHQVLLVSRCIGIHMSSCVGELNNYMIAFECAVDLHLRHMSSSHLGNLLFVVKGSKDSYLHFHEQYDKIDVHFNEMVGSFNMCFQDMFSRTKADTISSPVAYIEENQCIINGSCRNEACSVLNYFVTMIATSEIGVNVMHIEIINHAEELFMASVLKLMSCSLLQIIMFMRRDGFAGGLKALNDYSGSNEYDTLVEIISHFGDFMVKPPFQKILEDTLKACPENLSGTKLMLAHTVVLLIYSLHRRLAFLWKGCIFLMMTIIDLLNLEEGTLDSLKQLLGCMDRTPISPSSVKDNQSEIHQTGASAKIAFNMQYIKKVYLEKKTACQTRSKKSMDVDASGKQETGHPQFGASTNDTRMPDNMEEEVTCEPSLSVDDDDFCNGVAYINCLEKPSDFDGLADFIACKPGMDYSQWLKQRKRYRKWVIDKQTVVMKRRKKTALESFRCTRSMRARQK